MTCIVCPIGCNLIIDTNTLEVTGNTCKRGEIYGKNELTNPVRTITSTVKILGGIYPRLPVKTNMPIPKDLNFDCINLINAVTVTSPIKVGDVIIKNVLGTGADLIATRSM